MSKPATATEAADAAAEYAPAPSAEINNNGAMLSPNGVAKEKRKAFLAGAAWARANDPEVLALKFALERIADGGMPVRIAVDALAAFDKRSDK